MRRSLDPSSAASSNGLGRIARFSRSHASTIAAAPAEPVQEELEPWSVVYDVQPGQEFGPHWGSRRPPGLPAHARLASRSGAALSFIEQIAGEQALGDVFVTTVRHLSVTESGGIFARPANTFDARPRVQRPQGKPLITAWGALQFNAPAWRILPGTATGEFPWDSTPYDEIERPIAKYAETFADVLGAGGTDLDAARGVRLWHRTPVGYNRYLSRGGGTGFDAAWRQVPAEHRSVVDRHLRSAGVLQPELELASWSTRPVATEFGGRVRRDVGERKALLLHGTTASRGRVIVNNQAFTARQTFFAFGMSNRDLARIFAERTSSRFPAEGGPALVVVSVPEKTIDRLRQLRLFRALPFDPGDRPELRRRTQWVLEPGGVEIINRDIEDWRLVPRGRTT